MAPPVDPYRTLGLGRDATLDQVKRAYRRLAKANHPDTAGEAAVPRFLAIKAAYEAIAGPDATDASRAGRRPTTPRRSWEADPDRADATRRAYGSRGRRAQPGSGARPAGRSSTGRARPDGSPSSSSPPPSPEGDGAERRPNLATLGSTTYDGTEGQPFEPDWGGASWYGTTSGTYWTLNPKEYADPRKHGPEYQARARRARRQQIEAEGVAATVEDVVSPTEAPAADAGPSMDADPVTAAAETFDDRPPPAPAPGRPTHTTASWWDATAGAGGADPVPDAKGPVGREAPAGTNADDAAPPGARLSDRLRGTWSRGRIGLAVLGWAPIALGIDAVAGGLAGCAGPAIGCSSPAVWSVALVQVVALAILVLVPLLARLASTAAVVTGLVAIPAALILGAMGEAPSSGAIPVALGVVLVAAWLVGLGVAGVRESRRSLRPVS